MSHAGYWPHDLLWVAEGGVRVDGAWPEWADADWMRRAPVVVRREATAGALLPVGLRGLARNQRCKGYVHQDAVLRRVTPEMLAAPENTRGPEQGTVPRSPAPALASPRGAEGLSPVCAAGLGGIAAALNAIAAALDATGLSWGPTGGVGFYLATGIEVLRPDSDLDLLVRAPQPLDAARTAALAAIQAGADLRVDIQIDTGEGAFALAEWLRGGRVMLKTATGPRLCADPWQAGAAP
ncbi:malonate decarboxylase holo-ACP synthase [Pseudoduganella namucuonensis]|uniref:Phosphoribosyl-dephospho-CoA transferase n=1 Tax=Pseudoduganella namucuonensis TaxID=1035707 RepID=A0A1I7KRL5_9BURK|nr:malonate decarboxylase holo-ACP synthase [Pseudoduganella namucuonensis]SFV00059.1 phosphoribosyl-dephospho-CoA transferase [Pseudoduganella namucuonensis]